MRNKADKQAHRKAKEEAAQEVALMVSEISFNDTWAYIQDTTNLDALLKECERNHVSPANRDKVIAKVAFAAGVRFTHFAENGLECSHLIR